MIINPYVFTMAVSRPSSIGLMTEVARESDLISS